MTAAYYNDNDKFIAQWLRNLIGAGKISKGVVDERSIREVSAGELAGYKWAHFFAGIGGWDLSLKLAGWPTDREVWTGSCPCQPLSRAGKQRKESDERHLWPEFYRLIKECRPATIFGEQVGTKIGAAWFVGVRSDLEALGYRVAAADLCAASVGSPQIRQRIYWVADSNGERPPTNTANACQVPFFSQKKREPEFRSALSWGNSFVSLARDGKKRRLESGLKPVVKRHPTIMDLIRAYGNPIVPQLAAEFVKAFLETEEGGVI